MDSIQKNNLSGHRGVAAKIIISMENYNWKELKQNWVELVQSCLQCLTTDSRNNIPRSLDSIVHNIK